MKRRRGYSLLECLVVISLLASILGTVGWTMHALHRTDRRLGDALLASGALERLAGQLRADAHLAESAAASPASGETPAGRELSLTLPAERSVRYTLLPRAVERVVRRGTTLEHRETYPVVATAAGWQVTPSLISLTVQFEPQAPAVPNATVRTGRIDAAVRLVRTPAAPPATEAQP